MIDALIDKQDTFEIVRDQIEAILVNEVASQQAFAIAAGKDPDLWALAVYSERFNPLENWIELKDAIDLTPVVTIRFDSFAPNKSASNVVARQQVDAIYNLDIYATAIGTATAEGHDPADYLASLNAHRAVRLVRNILMAADYTYLDLRGLVGFRWVDSITSFQPELNGRALERIVGVRVRFGVSFNEFSPQVTPGVLESVVATVKREDDGKILAVVEYDYTA